MAGPPPAVAAVRAAVRRCLADLDPGDRVLVACSGGPDSLALAGALAFVAPRLGLRAGAVTVDHGLQEGAARQAQRVVSAMRELELDPVERCTVRVGRHGGPEGAARDARYAALERCAQKWGARAVFLGHTRDDQAETVLLGLARGSGARSLAGMAPRTGIYRRPLLELGRASVHEAAAELGLEPWQDPHNTDPSFARARVRHEALPALERALGPGVAEALSRTARLLRDDADAIDDWAREAFGAAQSPGGGLDVDVLVDLPRAVRTRLLRRLALDAGTPAGALTAAHVAELDRLVTQWRGQGGVALPGPLRGRREGKRIVVSAESSR